MIAITVNQLSQCMCTHAVKMPTGGGLASSLIYVYT